MLGKGEEVMADALLNYRLAINDVELALNGLEIDALVRRWEAADDSVMVKVPLGALRQLGRCFPALNAIVNDPAFEANQKEAAK